MKLKKKQVYKSWIIAENVKPEDEYEPKFQVFKKDEWEMGEGYRCAEFDDCGSIQECIDNIDSY
jgi:hypothetical protein